MKNYSLAWSLARRELKGGIKNFRIFLCCLALGVATIAGIGSISEGLIVGLQKDGRILLGGDIALRVSHRPISGKQRSWLKNQAVLSEIITMGSMAHRLDDNQRSLIYLKAIDNRYPLYGNLVLDRTISTTQLFDFRNGAWGAIAEPRLLERLGLKVGDVVRVGVANFQIRALINSEPDNVGGSRAIAYGPRFFISRRSIRETELIRPGAQLSYRYRLKLPKETKLGQFRNKLENTFPDAGWRIRDRTSATPGVQRIIDRTTQFITLVGLTALLIGGVGISNAVRTYLARKSSVIATLKCIGASRSLIFQIYSIEIGVMAMLGIIAGLIIGAILPILSSNLLSQVLTLPLKTSLFFTPLLLAATYGILIAAIFSLWPIARACDIAPGSLFRDLVSPGSARPNHLMVIVIGLLFISLGLITILTAGDRVIAMWFVGGAAVTFGLLFFAGHIVMILTSRLSSIKTISMNTSLRLALANVYRPGTQTTNIVLSMGLGLTVLVAVVMIETNLTRQIRETLPTRAPGYFFIDIQPNQVKQFEETVQSVDGVSHLDRVPMLRGRIIRVNGIPSNKIQAAPDVAWVLRSDRGLTWSALPPENTKIVDGAWWQPDYSGPPLISFDARAAQGLGIGVGDTLTINVLGRPITAEIANLRQIVWGEMQINFVILFSPGVIENAPQTFIASLHVTRDAESAVEREVSNHFPNITAIRVRDIFDKMVELSERIANAVRLTSGITVLAGSLVLIGAIASSHQRRIYDAVVLKVLGARPRNIVSTLLIEYALLAMATAAASLIMGSIAGWAVLTKVMRIDWTLQPAAATVTTIGASLIIVVLALLSTWRVLGQKAAPILRND